MNANQIILAVNKMDLVHFSEQAYSAIVDAFSVIAARLAFASVTAIPLVAPTGYNVTNRSARMRWYTGPTLLGALEELTPARGHASRFVFPVQWVNRPDTSFRGYSGTASGSTIALGDELRVAHSGEIARLSRIVTMDRDLTRLSDGQSVTLVLDRDVDVSRGDVLSLAADPVELTDQFEATLIWLDRTAGLTSRTYDLKLGTQWTGATITAIKYRVNVETMGHEAATEIAFNEICECNLALSKPVAYELFGSARVLGGFILVDRFSKATVAAGLIRHSLRRAQNIHRQALSVTAADRHFLNGHPGHVVWFTGLSGSGKSTLANALEVALHSRKVRTYLLDGDNVRQGLNRDLGFTDADRVENIRRIAEIAKLMMDAGLVVIAAFISPFEQERQMARDLIGPERFQDIYLSTSLQSCEKRDPKGLYKKARAGQLPNLTGIGSDYEVPINPAITIDTAKLSVDDSINKILSILPRSIRG